MKRPLVNVIIVLFLAVQVSLPVRGFLHDRFDTDATFSWNMYATQYGCEYSYVRVDDRGQRQHLPLDHYFHRPDKLHVVFHRDELGRFHRWLCELTADRALGGRIEVRVRCREGDVEQTLADTDDLCAAPDDGVVGGSRERIDAGAPIP